MKSEMVSGVFVLKPSTVPFTWVKKEIVDQSINEAIGAELAESVLCEADIPPYNLALRDGWAVDNRYEGDRRVVGEVINGESPKTISPNEALWINTGGYLPNGATAVATSQDYKLVNEHTLSVKPLYGNENVLPKGSEWKKGSVLIQAGSIIGASEAALLTDADIDTVKVLKRPAIGILATGQELKENSLIPGTRSSSDSVYLKILLESLGLPIIKVAYAGDDQEQIGGVFSSLADNCDFIVSIGGTGQGRADLLRKSIEKAGGTLTEGEEKLTSSVPYVRAVLNGKPIMGLPGNPLGMIMIAQRVLLPILWHRFRTTPLPTIKREAILGFLAPEEKGDIAIELIDGKMGRIALPLAKGTGRSMVFRNANGVIPMSTRQIKPGDTVEVELFLDGFHLLQTAFGINK
ncbi:MAG: molybdenum cofactor biosynthesis protein [Burkholderiales bacterium]|nr:molybdenum cofactor biosynthesis protein [Burkholderiales bacterium]